MILRLIFYMGFIYFIGIIPAACETFYTVTYVFDGDTVFLDDRFSVRLLGINAPETAHGDKKAEPYGDIAKAFLTKRVLGKRVRLETGKEKKDHYGRTLAYVFMEKGRFVNAEMVENGYAYVLIIEKNEKYQDSLIRLQRKAMSGFLGIWAYWGNEDGAVVGNLSSMRFHMPTCAYGKKTGKKNRKMFNRPVDAFFEGLSPCRRCFNEALYPSE